MKNEIKADEGKIVLYKTAESNVIVDVMFKDETFWLTKKSMSELFDTSVDNIGLHLKNIYSDEELSQERTAEEISIVQKEGNRDVKRNVLFYSLDAIIAVGYRVSSKKATLFRIWATKTLNEYIKKGFVINDEMMKNGKPFGQDYFDELLERIREIRSSERRAYQKITDIFEQCSSDYNKDSEETKMFYKIVQNKLHYAISGQTAAEIINDRVDSEKPYMGLTNWKNSPDGKILKSDVSIAKNYLNEKELDKLNRLVVMFIDHAEFNALDQVVMTMNDWIKDTNEFLTYNKQKLLENSGRISHELAVKKAEEEYEKYRVKQDREYVSNFDKEIKKYLENNKK